MVESETQEQIKNLRSTLLVLENQIFSATQQLLNLEKSLYEDELRRIRTSPAAKMTAVIIGS